MHQVEMAQRNGEEIEADVQDWLCKSKNQSDEASSFLANEGQIGMQHCSSSSMVSRYKSSKNAKKMKDVVNEIQDGGQFSKVSYRPILPNSVENEGYEAFETRMSIENEIMEALRDSSVSAVGVYGMPGAGKTTLAKEIAKKTKDEGLFLEVVMVVVSQTPDVIKIQKEIAEQLGLRLDEETQARRAVRLRNRLSKERKVLIVLDDIWDKLKLGNVGIHFEDDQKGCKLLFTSRSLDVLRNDQKVDKNLRIEPLSSSEAMNLYKKMVGVGAEQADFKALAADVVKECGGLPIAIVTVANALKNQGLSVWKDALRQLRNSSPTNIEGVSENVYSSVKLSYDSLRSEEAKSLFLLCSLHEEDERIDTENLMRYGVGWGLFQDIDTLDAARDRVNSLLDKLKARCLLLDGSHEDEDDSRVMMHDVIRDVGISIASEERRMINFKTAFKLEECSSKRKLKDSTAIFLRNVDNHIGKLECPELELFLSPGSTFHVSTFLVPDHFFEETKKLRAIDLSFRNLESAPSSFVLQNLVTLRLSGCRLGDVTFIGELKNLEILDLSGSNVTKLPRQIGELTRLRQLDLCYCGDLKVIEAHVISNLIRLEELYMEGGFMEWEVEGVSNTSLSEIKNLSRLTILSLGIPDASVLPKDLFPEKLEKFKISVGSDSCSHECLLPAGIKSLNLFCLRLVKSNQVAEHELEILMHKSEELHLEVFEDVNIISVNELERKGFPRLKNFWLEGHSWNELLVGRSQHRRGMKYIVNSEGHSRPCSVFPNLESLKLLNLEMLEKICNGKLAEESFGKLSVLDVRFCLRLKNAVQFSIAKRLEDITVRECLMIKEIVFQSEDENEAQLIPEVEFPRLRRLDLNRLPELVQFYRSHLETGTSSMLDCPMTPLFSEKVVFPSLIELKLRELSIKKLWPDQLPANSSSKQNLENLILVKCHSLEYLLSSTMAKGFSQLQYLRVKNCGAMKEIIATKELVEEGKMENISFRLLENVTLLNLPKLRIFTSSGTSMECPSLLNLTIHNCPKLSTFLDTNSTKKGEQEGMGSVATQFLFQEKRCGTLLPSFISFNNLKTLRVSDCSRVINLLASSTARGLVHLSTISIIKCKQLTEIITTSEEDETESEIVFRKLSTLELDDLPSLRKFYSGNISITFPELEKLILRRCPELLTLIIQNCPKLSTFMDTNSTKKDEQKGMSSVATQPLFHFQAKRCEILLPSFISFNNVKTLEVSRCPRVINLLASSTARGLVHLSTMSIIECKQLTEIITTSEEDEIEGAIVFRKLSTLKLDNLSSLRRFYSGKTSITFPELEKLILCRCPELQSFSHGTINSSKLTSIITQIDYEKINEEFEFEEAKPKELIWEGDINTTVLKHWGNNKILSYDTCSRKRNPRRRLTHPRRRPDHARRGAASATMSTATTENPVMSDQNGSTQNAVRGTRMKFSL